MRIVSTTVGTIRLQPDIGAGYRAIIILPSGIITSSARNAPSLDGSSGEVSALYATLAPARVRELMPAFRSGEQPERSMVISPCATVTRAWIRTRSLRSIPSLSRNDSAS